MFSLLAVGAPLISLAGNREGYFEYEKQQQQQQSKKQKKHRLFQILDIEKHGHS